MNATEMLVDSVHRQIVAKVEPMTRFDRSSFRIESSQTAALAVVAHERHDVAFRLEFEAANGKLPSDAKALSSDEAVRSHMEDCLATAEEELPQRLRAWHEDQASASGSPLLALHCYRPPGTYGSQTRCDKCAGTGKIECHWCRGRGRRDDGMCNYCMGVGDSGCDPCGKTGYRHRLARLRCTVESKFRLELPETADSVRRGLQAVAKLQQLSDLAPVGLREVSFGAARVEREFRATLPVIQVDVVAAGERFVVHGAGVQGRVFDFENIVGKLLQGDLERLEQALKTAPRWPSRALAALDAALGAFLSSGVNESIGQIDPRKTAAVEAYARNRLRGAASVDYAVRAARAVRAAASRVYQSAVLLPLATTLIVLVPCCVLLIASLVDMLKHAAPLAGLAAACVGVAGAELWARFRLGRRFDAEVASRLDRVLLSTWTLWAWRAALLIAAIAAVMPWLYVIVFLVDLTGPRRP
ncbi:zinc finger-like domain-containing protein [uncultured Methylibium sp.]|uniref:zinc finger-like domain-containing protein n=1 Tax=uncultured Methylibium sp. TaxID=381093 RepID=UPI0025F2F5D0|nr:zinc finger-like domain-containing protein [uncultured Methylibium sp.]